MSTTPKWTEERVAKLTDIIGAESPVSAVTVTAAAEALETTVRSVASKLRNMDLEVESMAKAHTKTFSDAEEEALRSFVENNAGTYTYAEIAESVSGGKFSAKEVQGKLLSMELTDKVKAAPKVEVAKKYTEAENVTFIAMMKDGAFIEDIAAKLGKTLNSVRGKALSLTRSDETLTMPKQRESHATASSDAFADLGDVSKMTVVEISEALDKSERGVKTMLTRRGVDCADYKGATKKAKIAEKADSEAA